MYKFILWNFDVVLVISMNFPWNRVRLGIRSGRPVTWSELTWVCSDPTRPESIQVYLIWTWDLNWPEYFLTRPDLNEIRSTWFRPETWTDLNLFWPDLNCMKSGRPESTWNLSTIWNNHIYCENDCTSTTIWCTYIHTILMT